MFGLFDDKEKMKQEVEIVMANYTDMVSKIEVIMNERLGIQKDKLRDQDKKAIGQEVFNFYNLLGTKSTRVKKDFITGVLQMNVNEFSLDFLLEVTNTAIFLKLIDEGKIDPPK